MIDQRIPEPVQPVLEKYISLTDQQLPGLINAFYILGSIALDGFNERFSDIDFMVTLNRRASSEELTILTAIHKAIEQDFPKWPLSGGYVQINDLGCLPDGMEPHPYYHDGKFHKTGYFEINSVTWWVLKHYGITIIGNEPGTLPFTVDWNLLVGRMKENLNSYWAGWTTRPGRILTMLSDREIQWTVLGVLRQYYTFRENSITTKLKAAEYALTCLPERWHPLIQEAIDIREGKKDLHYRSKIVRMIEAVKFLKFVIQTSNKEFP